MVIGGGIVGLTTGLALRKVGFEVTVYERAPEVRSAGAAFGLWRNALRVFEMLGILEAVNAIGKPADMYFHDPTGRLMDPPEFDAGDHRYLLVNRAHLTDLLADAFGRDGIRLGAHFVAYEEGPSDVAATFEDGRVERGDLLVGADGIYSAVRAHLATGSDAREHVGHQAWRAVIPGMGDRVAADVMVVGHQRCRGGSARTYDNGAFWLVSQFGSPPLTGTPKAEALARAAQLSEGGWNASLLDLIENTPEERILHNQVIVIPTLSTWVSEHVVLAGDAAHGMSPHITAGASLGVEDAVWLAHYLTIHEHLAPALAAYAAVQRADRRRDRRSTRRHGASDPRRLRLHAALHGQHRNARRRLSSALSGAHDCLPSTGDRARCHGLLHHARVLAPPIAEDRWAMVDRAMGDRTCGAVGGGPGGLPVGGRRGRRAKERHARSVALRYPGGVVSQLHHLALAGIQNTTIDRPSISPRSSAPIPSLIWSSV